MKTLYSSNDGAGTLDRIEWLSWSGQNISGFRLTVMTHSHRDTFAGGLKCVALMGSDRDLIPGSKLLQNHLLIEPVAALLEREETGYCDLRKALVSVSLNMRHSLFFLG